MYRPPDSDSEDDYDGFYFGDSILREQRGQFVDNTDQIIVNVIEDGDLDKLRQQIEKHNYDVNNRFFNGSTLLGLACLSGHYEMVKYLIENKANPNKKVDSITVLMKACASSKNNDQVTKIVETLVKVGAVINISDKYGTTPFMLACKNGHMGVVKLLMKDACFDACDNQGCTAIFHAVENNRPDIVQFLVQSGANATIANCKGYTPRQVAQFRGFYDVLEVLPKDEAQPYQVPTKFLTYNNIYDIIPRIFLKTECPEYFQDVNMILINIDMEDILKHFAREKVSLSTFLTTNDSRLKSIGIQYPIHRLKILTGLLNFHLHQWTKRSIARVCKGPTDNFYQILILSANHLQNLVIIASTLKYVKDNILAKKFGNISIKCIHILRKNLKNYRKATQDLNKTTKYLQSFNSPRPPLYIDYVNYLEERRNIKLRKFFNYTLFVAFSAAICLNVKGVFY